MDKVYIVTVECTEVGVYSTKEKALLRAIQEVVNIRSSRLTDKDKVNAIAQLLNQDHKYFEYDEWVWITELPFEG